MDSLGSACYRAAAWDQPPGRRIILGRASLVSLLLAAGIAMLMACAQAAGPPAATADPAQGGG